MNILVVGGGLFLGRRLVEAALASGHDVSTFTRGRHEAGFSRPVERLHGDRNGDVSALAGRYWDAVFDTCGYVPSSIERVLRAIGRDRIRHYTFVSSVSVYAEFPPGGIDESANVASIAPDQLLEAEETAAGMRAGAKTYGEWYGPLKALCEAKVHELMPGRVLNVRPGLIVGPYDYTDRFTYWVRRVARGGVALAPGRPARRVRVIDARDLAAWLIRMAENGGAGVFNTTGPEDGATMADLLATCARVSRSDAKLAWVAEQELLAYGVAPWGELPLWVRDADNGIFEVRNDKAIAAGLAFRTLEETVADTLEWDKRRPQDEPLKAGLTREREDDLLRRVGRDATNPAH